jgi:hypothetical protein
MIDHLVDQNTSRRNIKILLLNPINGALCLFKIYVIQIYLSFQPVVKGKIDDVKNGIW